MNEHLRQAIMLEKRCYQMFQAMGWDMTHTMETKLPGGTLNKTDADDCERLSESLLNHFIGAMKA